jgi:hypothetical protein
MPFICFFIPKGPLAGVVPGKTWFIPLTVTLELRQGSLSGRELRATLATCFIGLMHRSPTHTQIFFIFFLSLLLR